MHCLAAFHWYLLMASKKKTFLLRIDPDLWNELNSFAEQELRSVNGQIEYILRNAVKDRKKNFNLPPPDARIDKSDSV